VEAEDAEEAALVAEVAALDADVDAEDAEEAASDALVAASVAFSVTALRVASSFASPAPPTPRYIAMLSPDKNSYKR
jgi:hypothetical protein